MSFAGRSSDAVPRSPGWTGVISSLGPLLALVLVFASFALAERIVKRGTSSPPVMLTSDTLRTIVASSAIIGVCALGMTIVIISGGIDLSVGNGICLCATVLAACLKMDWPAWLAILACLASGCLMGAVNGGLVSLLRVVPFIITLVTMTIYLGIGKWLAHVVEKGGQTVRPDIARQVPKWLQDFTSNREIALWPAKTGVANVDAVLDTADSPPASG